MSTAPTKPVSIVVMRRLHRSSWATELGRSTVLPNLIGELLLRSVPFLSDGNLGAITGFLTYQEYGVATGSSALVQHSTRSEVGTLIFQFIKMSQIGSCRICLFFVGLDRQLLSVLRADIVNVRTS